MGAAAALLPLKLYRFAPSYSPEVPMAVVDKWIQGAVNPAKKGALHKDLGIPPSKKIPPKTLAAAAKKPGVIGERARFAENVKGK